MLAAGTHISFPGGAKFAIGFTGLLHTSVAALAIGFATIVTVMQIVGYRKKDRAYDLMAKRIQLYHVCIYNIGTIVAIGLVFCLSGLYPQFWSQLFVHMFWIMIVEELLFFLLATTLTLHYFFWEHMWGHKKLHIFLGSLLTPLFLLQIYLINGMGAFMMTPGFEEGQASMSRGILGWDKVAFYNPSFLMLQFHRTFANVAYGGFIAAAIAGVLLYRATSQKQRSFLTRTGRLAFTTAFICYLSLPIIGYFYSWVLKYHANEAYVNLMWGRGDVVAGGIDWWWVKHLSVAGMFGACLAYFHRTTPAQRTLVYAVALFYMMFYMAMGMIMTWKFFWISAGAAAAAALLARHLLDYHEESPRGVFVMVGFLSFMTVMLGGYVREAARPRFVSRIAAYNDVYVPEERQQYLMVDVDPSEIPPPPEVVAPAIPEAVLIRERCSGCHTLERVHHYPLDHWDAIVKEMQAYGLKLTGEEAATIADYLKSGEHF